jgi:hypothetical protein
MTGVIQAAYANYLINDYQRAAGFCSAVQAVGHREMLGQLQNFGYIGDVTTA